MLKNFQETQSLVDVMETNIDFVQSKFEELKKVESPNIKDISDMERYSNMIQNFSKSIAYLKGSICNAI